MSNIKNNAIFNGLNTLSSVLFPLITFPYAARVLMPEGIGTISFLNGIVSYILLITSLGIPLYAVKEIAQVRDNSETRILVTREILSISCILCAVGYVIVWLCAKFIPQIREQSSVFYALSLSILFTAIGVEWFYQAIEDFRFITVRALIVRTISAVSLFIFVKSPGDLLIYAFVLVGSTIGNNILNFIHLRKYGIFSSHGILPLTLAGLSRHIKPILVIFSIYVLSNFYLTLNSVMLGFLSTETEVGFYTAATRLIQILIALICSIGTVLVPRLSNLLSNGEIDEFNRLAKKSLGVTMMLSIPVVTGLIILAEPIIMVFCGAGYMSSISVLTLVAPVILLSSLSALIGWQILFPSDKTHIVVVASGVGAIVNLILNFLLIPDFGCNGAAISLLGAEFAVLTTLILYGKRYIPFSTRSLIQFKYCLAAIVMTAVVLPLSFYLSVSYIVKLIIIPIAGIIVYAVCLILMRDELFISIIGKYIKLKKYTE